MWCLLLVVRHDLFSRGKETGQWPDDKEANKALAAACASTGLTSSRPVGQSSPGA